MATRRQTDAPSPGSRAGEDPRRHVDHAHPEQGRDLALTLARHTVHNIQPDLDALVNGRPHYSHSPEALIAASHVVAVEFATIAAANDYWR